MIWFPTSTVEGSWSHFNSHFGNPKDEKDALTKIRESIKFTALQLGNTPKVCRDSYIDPILIDKYHNRGLKTHE